MVQGKDACACLRGQGYSGDHSEVGTKNSGYAAPGLYAKEKSPHQKSHVK